MPHVKLKDLLGLALKSDEVVEVLEHFDLPVIYDFDRSNEGIEDIYWVSAHRAGFELRFDSRQVLETIFLYAVDSGEFQKINPAIAGVSFFGSYDEAKADLQARTTTIKEGANRAWIKGIFSDYYEHHEFNTHGVLTMVTICSTQVAA